MKRIVLLVLTNLAVVALLLVTAGLLGVDRFLSLAMSKWMAKTRAGRASPVAAR